MKPVRKLPISLPIITSPLGPLPATSAAKTPLQASAATPARQILGLVSTGGASSLDREVARMLSWTETQVSRDGAYFAPTLRAPASLNPAERAQMHATVDLYKKTFDRFLWSGFECSNPVVDGSARWDQNQVAGLYDVEKRRAQISTMRSLGIENARVGVPNHLVAPQGDATPYNFDSLDALLGDMTRKTSDGALKLSLDIMHFGLPDVFRADDPKKSWLLNPAWPQHFANLALATVQRYPKLEAITLINEPFVTNNFSASHWNEAVPGNAAFIDRALLIAQGAVTARAMIEDHLQETGTRKLFLHNDSCEYRSDDDDFNAYRRFLVSDLILGADWLLEGDYQKSDTFAWLCQHGEDREKLVAQLDLLVAQHRGFAEKHGKAMKADTVFGLDYYVACEMGPGITHDPQLYPAEAQKTRKGLYEMGMDYFNRYRMPLMHAETNMREDQSQRWMTQQLIELGGLVKSGVPVLGATWYSILDQVGWENGMRGPVLHELADAKAAGRLNTIGLVSLETGAVRPAGDLMRDLGEFLGRSEGVPEIGRPRVNDRAGTRSEQQSPRPGA